MSKPKSQVVNLNEVEEVAHLGGEHWGGYDKQLTPPGAHLGVSLSRVPPGRSMCPFHSHQLEDEVFLVMSGRGVLRYGEEVRPLRAGDTVYCPAGTGVAHQLGNPFQEDLVYLAIGPHEPNEVCVYPDNGKIMVRSLQAHGYLQKAPYLEGEPTPPKLFTLAASVLDSE
jgi:uncharacterized cupin superfamily protein